MSPQDDRYRVYMYFQYRNGWHCQFLEADLKTPLSGASRLFHKASK